MYRYVRDEVQHSGRNISDGTLTCCVPIARLVKVTGFVFGLFSASERCSMFPEGDPVGPDDLSFVTGEDSTR